MRKKLFIVSAAISVAAIVGAPAASASEGPVPRCEDALGEENCADIKSRISCSAQQAVKYRDVVAAADCWLEI